MIYFDNNATTQIAPEVLEAMMPYLQNLYGNPSAVYNFGCSARKIIEDSREQVTNLIGANSPHEIIFTSCGTESDNHAVLGSLEAFPGKKHIITTSVEHDAIRKLCQKLETTGFEITWLDVDENGFLNLEQLKDSLRDDTAIVSVMLANNETGILFPVEEVAEIVKENSNALFHVDGVNAVGKIPVDLKNTKIDLFSLSGHKFYAPKGIGALYVREEIKLPSFFIGGGQENSRRAGTEAVHQIAGIGKAAELAKDFSAIENVRRLRDKLEDFILQNISHVRLNGTANRTKRLPNTTSISFSNLNGENILAKLNDLEICVSTGSACSSASHTASATLQAMNIPYTDAMGAVRFSLGKYNTETEVDFVIEKLPKIIEELRRLNFEN